MRVSPIGASYSRAPDLWSFFDDYQKLESLRSAVASTSSKGAKNAKGANVNARAPHKYDKGAPFDYAPNDQGHCPQWLKMSFQSWPAIEPIPDQEQQAIEVGKPYMRSLFEKTSHASRGKSAPTPRHTGTAPSDRAALAINGRNRSLLIWAWSPSNAWSDGGYPSMSRAA